MYAHFNSTNIVVPEPRILNTPQKLHCSRGLEDIFWTIQFGRDYYLDDHKTDRACGSRHPGDRIRTLLGFVKLITYIYNIIYR